jgi:hypothetical protein
VCLCMCVHDCVCVCVHVVLLVLLFLFLSLLLHNVAVGVYETESGVFRLISDGDLPSAVAASCAIPYIFQPVQGTLHIGRGTAAVIGIVIGVGTDIGTAAVIGIVMGIIIGIVMGGSITIFDLSLSMSLSLSILYLIQHSPLITLCHFLFLTCSSFHVMVSLAMIITIMIMM